MTWEELLPFFDDVLVFSPTFAKHCESLDRALTLIEEAGLKVKPEKCRVLPQRVHFAGHILSAQGVCTDPEKVSAVKSRPLPTNVSQLRAFLGKIGYYRKFIPDFATLAAPRLEEKGRNFVWSNDCQTASSTKQGHWQWKRVPFGLCNATPFFVRQIASLLAGMTWEELLPFFDDVLVFSPTFGQAV